MICENFLSSLGLDAFARSRSTPSRDKSHAMTRNAAFKLETYARVIGSESVTVWMGYVLLCRNWGSR